MAPIQKCPRCGLDFTADSAAVCPACRAKIVTTSPWGTKVYIGVLIPFAFSTIFMLVFGFSKIMIAFFGAMIFAGTALSTWAKSKAVAAPPTPQRTIAHPSLFKILTLAIALCSLALAATLLFSFVSFMNSWSRWHTYDGQPYHRAEFQVKRAYFQRGSKGGIDIYASGTVEDLPQWMDLESFVHTLPRSQEELDDVVPAGTSIPIYLFPNLKGRTRVRVYQETPPAEAYRSSAMNAVHYGLGGLALGAGLLFVLSRVRQMCFVRADPQFPQVSMGQS